jgi:hypothetical protein
MKHLYLLIGILLLFITSCTSDAHDLKFIIYAQDFNLINAPVYVDVEMEYFRNGFEVCLYQGEQQVPAQVENLTATTKRIWWLANVEKGDSATFRLAQEQSCSDNRFTWVQVSDNSSKLIFNNQPVILYEYPVYDSSNPEETHKPFHHVYDPSGSILITKGQEGLHPGIFFGYNEITINGNEQQLDLWHARNGERTEHHEMLIEFTGPIMGGHIVRIMWRDGEGFPFLEEKREIRVFKQSENDLLIDFRTTLATQDSVIRLGGDSHHAGVQFWAQVAGNPKLTRFIRPAKWNEFAQDSELKDEQAYGLPWNAMHFVVEDIPITVAYLSHPGNGENGQMSERLYGRFGEFVPAIVTPDQRFDLHYRFWIKSGEIPDISDIERRYNVFVSKPNVKIIHSK